MPLEASRKIGVQVAVGTNSASVAAGAEFAVQLPVETGPVVDDGPGDEKYAAHVCEDSRSGGGSLDAVSGLRRCWYSSAASANGEPL